MNIPALDNQASAAPIHRRWASTMFQLLLVFAIAASAQDEWTFRVRPTADLRQTFDLNSVAWNGRRYVAVGEEGGIVTSSNGREWEDHSIETLANLQSVAWTGSLFLAVGSNGKILQSVDGNSWSDESLPVDSNFYSVAWTGNQVIMVGKSGHILTTPDGNWPLQAHPTTTNETFNSVIGAGNQIVIVGSGGVVYTSPDGNDWAKRSSSLVGSLRSVAWTGTQLVAVGDAGLIVTSPDGGTWTTRISGTTVDLTSVCWSGHQLLAVGVGGAVFRSSEGTTWTKSTTEIPSDLSSAIWADSQFVVVGGGGAVWSSKNGLEWSEVSIRPANGSEGITGRFVSVTSTGSQFVAVGNDDAKGIVLRSPDGIRWTKDLLGSSGLLNDVVWTGTKLVAVGRNGEIWTSTDAISWVKQVSGTDADLRSLVWTGKQLVAVGPGVRRNGTILTSTDGERWNVDSTTAGYAKSVMWTGNQLVVNTAGGVLLSTNGVAWKEVKINIGSGLGAGLYSMVWSGYELLTRNIDGNRMWSSLDGEIWTEFAPGRKMVPSLVVQTPTQIVAVAGGIYSSAEGEWWHYRGAAPFQPSSIAAKDGLLVAVSETGEIATSPEVLKASGVAPRKSAPHPASLGVNHAFRPDAAFDIFGRRTNSVRIKR